jgi:hypothetical protein
MDWHPHLFDDFLGIDCCIVIKSPDEFARRLERAAASLLPRWHFHHCPIGYFDTHQRRSKELIDNAMSKDFRFFLPKGNIASSLRASARSQQDTSTWNLVPCMTIAELQMRP